MAQSIVEARHSQAFPVLLPEEIERVRRFGQPRSFAAGEHLASVGEHAPGVMLILSGKVDVFQSKGERRTLIVTHEPGGFMGELAQLGGRPALIDAIASEPVDVLVIPVAELRSLLIAEAELGERIMRALILRRIGLLETGAGGPIIVGSAENGDVLRLEGFLTRNGHPHQRLDPESDPCGRVLVEKFEVSLQNLPIVLCPNGRLLHNPSETELARCIGLISPLDPDEVHDVAIVGAGPAGLATAVYAASEGLSVLVLDCRAFGGQAGASARIENYLGFPTGITGMALMARAYNQALKFGADMVIPCEAKHLEPRNASCGAFVLQLGDAGKVRARSVVLASGVRYRRLDVPNLSDFEMTSIHYWASPLEANLCAKQEVALVGAGNSAGQAVVYLASRAKKVWLLARGGDLDASMSRYLVDRIRGLPNVEVLLNTEVTALDGSDGRLETVRWRKRSGEEEQHDIRHLFLFIGADPNTDWLHNSGVALDGKGFVLTGAQLPDGNGKLLETSRPGIFAIGDVRSGSVKRVAASVGEGAQVVAALHAYLAEEPVSAKVA
ncbi:FAD-dependent oxidoreductase [Hyphomicrobium sp. NDB2Meth4]|uniref:FAD-dependent oxidoreductase n=1 Tax=Hyphomicrobium sp. NDB2Meth4 TaxID=1892846 RepID=UPI000931D401|nr:FAD-dependent oxidoreductase [Hyphomicrobium sp. NDB2Meth4]